MEKRTLFLENIFIYTVYYIFLFFVFFPYLRMPFFHLNTDLQPNFLVIGLFLFILFLVYIKRLPIVIWILFFVFCYALLMLKVFGFSFISLRSLANYLSLFITTLIGYLIVLQLGFPRKFFFFAVVIYFLVSIIQILHINFLENILNVILLRISTSIDRGVTSLAPEPTFYGLICIFFLIFNKLFVRSKFLEIFLVIQIIFLSKSFTAFLLLIIFYFFQLRIINLFVTLPLFVISIIIFLQNTRLFHLFNFLLKNPIYLFLLDASGCDRFFHIILSFYGFFQNCFLPHGYNAWNSYVQNIINSSLGKYIIAISQSGRIMSGYGSAVFELGWIGLFLPVLFSYVIHKYMKSLRFSYKDELSILLTFNITVLLAIPIGFPLIPFLIGSCLALFKRGSLPRACPLYHRRSYT